MVPGKKAGLFPHLSEEGEGRSLADGEQSCSCPKALGDCHLPPSTHTACGLSWLAAPTLQPNQSAKWPLQTKSTETWFHFLTALDFGVGIFILLHEEILILFCFRYSLALGQDRKRPSGPLLGSWCQRPMQQGRVHFRDLSQ